MTKKYGLIGCGMMGMEHVRNVGALEGAQISVVYDPVSELAQIAAEAAGGADIAASVDELIARPELDAIVIVSPNYCHVDQLEQIAKMRDIPILCEKPLYTKHEDAARIEALKKNYKSPIWVAMEYRYMPPIAEFIRLADEATGGVEMLTIREHRFAFLPKIGDWNRFNENTGGTLVEKCCHFFDLMRLIMKSEPVRVMASAGQITNHLDESYNGKTPDIWDGGYVIFEFENGRRAMLELCMFADGTLWNEEICAVGAKGKIETRLPGPSRFWPEEMGEPPHPQLTLSPRSPKNPQTKDIPIDHNLLMIGDHHGSTFYQHKNFLEVVKGNGSPEVSMADGAKAVAMGLAAQKSAIDHCVVEMN